MRSVLLATVAPAFLVLLVAHCGGSTSTGTSDGGPIVIGGRTPAKHRAVANACPRDRPPVTTDAGVSDAGVRGTCANDVDCTAGNNGRCVPGRGGPYCTYDGCFVDGDCTGGRIVCQCRTDTTSGYVANGCLLGNCKIDSDCGNGGFCSPSFGSCGQYSGVEGYYCHTPNDTCIDDSECTDGGSLGTSGYCAWDPKLNHWACSYTQCAG